MKRVLSHTCSIMLATALALAGCFTESTQANGSNPPTTTATSSTPAPTPAAAPATPVTLAQATPPITPASNTAPAAPTFREGVHYTVISPPIPTQVPPGKAEVVEMFWYGCPHCYALEPTIHKFLQNKPANVEFRRVPATLSPRWAYHAKLFYVGQMLDPNGEKNVHSKTFDALHKQHRKIDNDDALQRFFSELGFTPDQINKALQSMEMQTMLARSDELGAKSKADSVPVLIVNGKYMTSPSRVGSEDALLQLIDYLSKQ